MTFEEAHTTQQIIRSFQEENPEFPLELVEYDKILIKHGFLVMKIHVHRNHDHFKNDLLHAKKELTHRLLHLIELHR